ncbi:hypothetical protein ABH935_007190 [Catenulispora sp. GAS73]|uniref:hypothetical protein n=1 Tax=Catenulispora sp. GAS73 TaxID=3156269 RepID=UPI0035130F08
MDTELNSQLSNASAGLPPTDELVHFVVWKLRSCAANPNCALLNGFKTLWPGCSTFQQAFYLFWVVCKGLGDSDMTRKAR